MKELQALMNEISEWSDATFGKDQRNPAILHHLQKEIKELIHVIYYTQDFFIKQEFAECFMLLLDSAKHYGLSADDLLIDAEYYEKQEKRFKNFTAQQRLF